MAHPFASIGRARTAVGKINSDMKSDIVVYLRAGQYFLSGTEAFDPSDSGSNGFTVHYAAYPADAPAQVLLHGGLRVTGWSQIDAGRNIWAAPLPAGVRDTRQLYIGSGSVGGHFDRMNLTNTGTTLPSPVALTPYGYTSGALTWGQDSQQNMADIEFLYTGIGSSWTECRLRVESISMLPGGGANITMQQPGYALGRGRYDGQQLTFPASVSNVYALLSAETPGQYYMNSATRTAYYVPRLQDNMTTAVVIVPTTETLLSLIGNRTAQPAIQPVHHLSFEGLTFAFAGWLEPNTGVGYVDMQSAFRVMPSTTVDDDTWVPVPGNVQMHTVRNVSVLGCTFTHLGLVCGTAGSEAFERCTCC